MVFAADKGYLPYDPGKTGLEDGILRAKEPLVTTGFTTGIDIQTHSGSGELSINDVFYVYENETSLAPPENSYNKPTKVVLKGIWQDGEGSAGQPITLIIALSRQADRGIYEKAGYQE